MGSGVRDGSAAPSHEELAQLVSSQAATIKALDAEVSELKRRRGQHSGNSGKPPSRDPAAERQRQAEERRRRAEQTEGAKRKRGKQHGAPGSVLEMSATPDEVVDHRPGRCDGCGAALDRAGLPAPPGRRGAPVGHRAPGAHLPLLLRARKTAALPEAVHAPVSYGPRARAVVAYLLGRQHLPNRRVKEVMEHLFGLPISTGTVDSVYAEAGQRLGVFVAALVALMKTLPVLHVDETTDRIGTQDCWMHVVSTGLYTLIHASVTRGKAAIGAAGALLDYRVVVVHDRLALYWKLKAKHGLCGAHLLRDLANVAVAWSQTASPSGLAALLVEINGAYENARLRGLERLAPAHQHALPARYHHLVAQGLEANPEPEHRKRDYVERRSFNLVTAFSTHRRSILRYMSDLDVCFTNYPDIAVMPMFA